MQAVIGQLFAMQRQLLQKLVDLENQIRRNHAETMTALSVVNHNVLAIHEWLKASDAKELGQCISLLKPGSFEPLQTAKAGEAGALRSTETTRFASYQEFLTTRTEMPVQTSLIVKVH